MKKLLITTALLSTFAASAFADDTSNMAAELATLKAQVAAQQKMIEKLEKNLNSKITKQEKDIAVLKTAPSKVETTSVKLASAQASAQPSDVKITMSPSPKIETVDGKYSFQPFGRLQLDTAFFQDDKTDHPDGSTFRRARLGFKGKVDNDIEYKAEFDFGNKNATENGVAYKDVYIAYTGLDPVGIRVGNFKPAFGLEELTSDNYGTFIERSLPTSSFATGEIIGAQVYGGGDHYSWALGAHNDAATTKSTDDEAKSVVGRVSYAPIAENGKVLHLGASASYRIPDRASDSASFSTTAENSIQQAKSVATGTISGVDSMSLGGLEAAGVYGPFSLQSEYFHTSVNRQTAADADFGGWYAQASWFVTGESRNYSAKTGTFERVKPKSPFSLKNGGIGAWELAARYSMLDLTDGAITGGKVDDITLGVNWYLTGNTRLMANYIISNRDNVAPLGGGVAANDDPKIMLLRAAIDF
jgi:phosphate-selective porin OprO/OprP